MGSAFSSKKNADGQVSPAPAADGKDSKINQSFDNISYQISKQNAKLAQGIQEMTGNKSADITHLGDEYEYYKSKSNAVQKIIEMLVKCIHDFRPSSLMEKIGFDKESSTFEHAVANTAADASENKQLDDPLKSLLFKMSVTEFQLGQNFVKRSTDVALKVETPLAEILKTTVKESVKAQKSTDSARFQYDSARLRLKKATEKTKEKIQKEVDDLKKALDESAASTILKMKAVTESTALGNALIELIKLQEEYHKNSAASMTEFLPIAQDLFVQHEKAFAQEKKHFPKAEPVAAANESKPVHKVATVENPSTVVAADLPPAVVTDPSPAAAEIFETPSDQLQMESVTATSP